MRKELEKAMVSTYISQSKKYDIWGYEREEEIKWNKG